MSGYLAPPGIAVQSVAIQSSHIIPQVNMSEKIFNHFEQVFSAELHPFQYFKITCQFDEQEWEKTNDVEIRMHMQKKKVRNGN